MSPAKDLHKRVGRGPGAPQNREQLMSGTLSTAQIQRGLEARQTEFFLTVAPIIRSRPIELHSRRVNFCPASSGFDVVSAGKQPGPCGENWPGETPPRNALK